MNENITGIIQPVYAGQFSIHLSKNIDPYGALTMMAEGINIDFIQKQFNINMDFSYNEAVLTLLTNLLEKCDELSNNESSVQLGVIDINSMYGHCSVFNEQPAGRLSLIDTTLTDLATDFSYKDINQTQKIVFKGSYKKILPWRNVVK